MVFRFSNNRYKQAWQKSNSFYVIFINTYIIRTLVVFCCRSMHCLNSTEVRFSEKIVWTVFLIIWTIEQIVFVTVYAERLNK